MRVDHPGDLVQLKDDDELIPAQWRKPGNISGTSQWIRNQGNIAVGKKNWAEAERLYTMAVEAAVTEEEEQLAYLNRSLANLRLGRPAIALADAVKGGGGITGQTSEKGLFREASALYQLGNFDACLQRLQSIAATYPSSASVHETRAMIGRVRARLHEQAAGEYNFAQMYKQAKATPPLIDCATYSGPVEIRESPGKGRGLFTTRKVAAGELLLCEKAFGYSYAGPDDPVSQTRVLVNLTSKRVVTGGQANLLTSLVQKAYHDHDAARTLSDLHHGHYKPVTVAEVEGRPVVDSFLIERVMSLNVFGAPRTSRESVVLRTDAVSDHDMTEEEIYKPCGIWRIISHINHACLSNCRRSFIGDMQLVRATKDMDAGTELSFCYHVPQPFESYNETQKRFEHWGFTCDCAICLEKKSTAKTVNVKRKILKHELKRAINNAGRPPNIPKASRALLELEQTYGSTGMKPGAVRLDAWEVCFALGLAFLRKDDPLQAIDMTLKGLEALGFIITASPRRRVKSKQQQVVLHITRWGMANEFAVNAFLHISNAYLSVAPALSSVARRYAETAYLMVVGEKETFLDTYPEFK